MYNFRTHCIFLFVITAVSVIARSEHIHVPRTTSVNPLSPQCHTIATRPAGRDGPISEAIAQLGRRRVRLSMTKPAPPLPKQQQQQQTQT